MRSARSDGRMRRRGRAAADERRELRLDAVRDVVERFSYGLALLMAGRDTDLEDYTEPALALRLRSAMTPFLASGDAMRPDFGAFGELRVDGDLLADETPIEAVLEFDDRSFRETADGRLLAPPRQRIQLRLRIALEPCQVIDCALTTAD
jgi:hypothetical protein